MSVTVQDIYGQICNDLLEPGGFVLGIYSQAQFLRDLASVLLDFSQRAPLDKLIYTQQIVATTADYAVPDLIMQPELCFVGGKLIERVTEQQLTESHLSWQSETGPPRQWHEDNLPIKTVELFPNPITSGSVDAGTYGAFLPAENNLTVVGPGAPSKTSWALGDTLDGIPDSFSYYLIYGVLEKIFGSESEMRDVQRAAYCHTRYAEGISLTQAIARRDLMEDPDE